MITAVVLAGSNVEALATTLGALVPGVARGLVTDAIVVAREPQEGAAAVADALGATHFVTSGDPWFAAAAIARQDWLLCLNGGDVPCDGWMEAAEQLIWRAGDARLGAFSRRPNLIGVRLSSLAASAFGITQVRAGDLVHRGILAEGRISARRRPVRLGGAIGRPRG